MPQFPQWKLPTAGWTDAAPLRQSRLGDLISDLIARANRAVELAERTRAQIAQFPGAIVDELRRRLNVLDLATKNDVEVQSKLGRSRVSYVLKEFLEAQRGHDEELRDSLRSDLALLREELQAFAAAMDDDLFEVAEPVRSTVRPPPRSRADVDELMDDDDEEDDDDDELDLVGYDSILATED